MDNADLLRFGLYALTVLLGVALLLWTLRGRRATDREYSDHYRANTFESNEASARTVIVLDGETARRRNPARASSPMGSGGSTINAVRGLPSKRSMAEAIEGIRLPIHWNPEPPVEVTSPFRISSSAESAGEMAATLSDELVRLGYHVAPTGTTSARAIRDDECLSVQVFVDEASGTVSSLITLTEASRG